MVDFRVDVVVDPRGAVAGSRAVRQELGGIINSADKLRTTLVAAFSIFGTGALIGTGVRTLATFEQSLSTVKAVSGATADQFAKLEQATRDLGVTTKFSAQESAEALVDLTRAGFSVDGAIAALAPTLALASAGGIELAAAADIASSTLNGFRLSAADMSKVADILTVAANSTNTNVRELGDSFKFVAPVAVGMGVSLEEAAAATGLFSNAGLKGSLAGTALKAVVGELEAPSTQTAKALEALGVKASDVRVSSVGLATALQTLKDAGVDAGLALKLFGLRGGPGFEILARQIPKLEQLTESLRNAEGEALKTSKVMNDNLGASLKFLSNAFEALILSIGKAGGSAGLRGLVASLSEGFLFLAANAETLIRFVQNLALFFGPRYLLGALRALTAALAANPFTAIAVAASLLISLIPDLQDKLNQLVDFLKEIGGSLGNLFSFDDLVRGSAAAIDGTIALFEGFVAALGALFDQLGQQPEVVGELITKAFRDSAEATLDLFLAMFRTLGDLFRFFGTQFVELIEQSVISLREVAAGNLEGAVQAKNSINAIFSGTLDTLKKIPQQFQNNFKKLRDIEILPEVELSQQAVDLGKTVALEFQRGIEEAKPVAAQIAEDLLGGSTPDLAAEAQKRLDEIAKNAPTEKPAAFVPPPVPLSDRAADILRTIEVNKELLLQEEALKEIYAERPELLSKLNEVFLSAQIAALEASTSMEDGFTRAFLKIQQEAQDFASVAEQAVNIFVDGATDALTNFVKTGELNFKKFAVSILEEISRIIIRLLVVQALSAALGAAGVSAQTVSSILGTQAPADGGGGKRAKGGTVQPDRSYIVGENGPEIYQPGRTGTIIPNSAPAEQKPTNIQVINIDDPSKIPASIASGDSDEAILNFLSRNKGSVNQILR